MAGTQILNPLDHSNDLPLATGAGEENEFSQPDYPELQDLAMSLLGAGDEFDFGSGGQASNGFDTAPISLELADLLADDSGALVLTGDNAVEIHAMHNVVEHGIVQDHLHVGGEDVSGFEFVVFDHGPTLYYPAGLDVAVTVGDQV
ncbi:MAG: hypothetical protein R3C97_12645 [Geminicoccaceae bacterium]